MVHVMCGADRHCSMHVVFVSHVQRVKMFLLIKYANLKARTNKE